MRSTRTGPGAKCGETPVRLSLVGEVTGCGFDRAVRVARRFQALVELRGRARGRRPRERARVTRTLFDLAYDPHP